MKLQSWLISLIILISACYTAQAQSSANQHYYYLIQLKDKTLNYVNINEPESFLSKASIERRKKFNIPIDSMDLPVTKAYIDNVRNRGIHVLYPSKWLNALVVKVEEPDSARILLNAWYVSKVVYLGKGIDRWSGKSGVKEVKDEQEVDVELSDKETYGKSFEQIEMLNGMALHALGRKGSGINIAVFDEGFYKVNKLALFSHLMKNQQIKASYDLVDGDRDVFKDGDHGMKVLSCMAGSKKKSLIGTSPMANFYLFRTENNSSEYLIEELHWIRAAEIADSLGVDLINSSLGYTTFDDKEMNHSWNDLDGQTTYVSRGANIAASRGILVVNSAGNDGNKKWKYLDPPADAPDILTVGAVDLQGNIAAFSSSNHPGSYHTKPDIVAPGKGVYLGNSFGTVSTGNGTSYACPITAGLCACLMELNPRATPRQIIRAIQKSGKRSYYPDNQYGYGLPDFILANTILGGNPDFDYSKVQFVQQKDLFSSNVFMVDVYTQDYSEMVFTVEAKKRFLFIPYYKKINKSRQEIEERFTRTQVFIPEKYKGKTIRLKASLSGSGSNTKNKTIYHQAILSE